METPYRPLTKAEMDRHTMMAAWQADEMVKAVDAYRADAEAEERKERPECRRCYYLKRSRVGGAAMTTWRCGLCGESQLASSTNHDRVCRVCALAHRLCAYCGGDVDMRERRCKWPEPADDLPFPDAAPGAPS